MKYLLTVAVIFLTAGSINAQELTKITFATDWKAQAEHGGFYQALAKGYYRDAGLDVTIRPGGPQSDNPRLIAAGALEVAMASNSFQPINMRAVGVDVKVVMASFQKDPQVMMVHPHVEAQSLADLQGRPVFLSDAAIAAFWPWLKAEFGFEDKQIRKYNYSLAPWLVNKETVQEGYLSSEPFTAVREGVKPKVFLFADAGYPGYAGMVMVRGAYLKQNKDVVKAFVEASIKGWQDYMYGNPNAANKLILKDNPEMTQPLIDYAIAAFRANNMTGKKENIGHMTLARWRQFYNEMSSLDAVPKGVDVESILSPDFIMHERASDGER
ncbi:ABC transporter substrate-binding protein [Kordiimonas aquimaris]|uniref:ABC transporter substrate-binding protein n=1 Tax=Kordiimonas aquimaris TaxID=707591 RepID=UPI0021CEB8F6|nr:ABC transporter substrate-binding protein [Kordiimonas aquimaris]